MRGLALGAFLASLGWNSHMAAVFVASATMQTFWTGLIGLLALTGSAALAFGMLPEIPEGDTEERMAANRLEAMLRLGRPGAPVPSRNGRRHPAAWRRYGKSLDVREMQR